MPSGSIVAGDVQHGRADRRRGEQVDALLRTTSRPARSSVSASRSAAATPTPMPSTSAPRRQYPATTRPKAARKNRPTSRIGHCPREHLAGELLERHATLRFGELDDVGQQERPRQRADAARVRRHVARHLPHVRVHVADQLARLVAADADVDDGGARLAPSPPSPCAARPTAATTMSASPGQLRQMASRGVAQRHRRVLGPPGEQQPQRPADGHAAADHHDVRAGDLAPRSAAAGARCRAACTAAARAR